MARTSTQTEGTTRCAHGAKVREEYQGKGVGSETALRSAATGGHAAGSTCVTTSNRTSNTGSGHSDITHSNCSHEATAGHGATTPTEYVDARATRPTAGTGATAVAGNTNTDKCRPPPPDQKCQQSLHGQDSRCPRKAVKRGQARRWGKSLAGQGHNLSLMSVTNGQVPHRSHRLH